MNELFNKLDEDKRLAIINSGLEIFAYWSNDERIIDIVKNKVISYDNFNIYEYTDNVDKSKFKNEEDIHKVIEMLSLMLDGYIQNKLKMNKDIDINEMMNKYNIWTSLLKEAVYK